MVVDVMIVDDSATIRKITVGKILDASDGREALEKLKSQPANLVLSDINMPNMDGIQFLSELKSRAEYKNVPVIMITTEGGEAKVMDAVQLSASGNVRKPFTADQIKKKLCGLSLTGAAHDEPKARR